MATARVATYGSATLLAALALAIPVAAVAARVNACAQDTQTGPGLTNLRDAVAAGGDVTFQCPPGTQLRVTMSHAIARFTTIDGGGTVTLVIDPASLPAFSVASQQHLRLRRITLRGAGTIPPGRSPGLTTVLVGRGAWSTWTDVTVRGLARPMFVLADGRGVIEGGSFTDGADPLRSDDGYLQIGGGTTFTRWTTAVRLERGRLHVARATFRRSRLVLNDCDLSIADAQFEDNDVRASGLSGGAIETSCRGVIERSLFRNNSAANGGAIELRSISDLRLFRVRFFGNRAANRGGAVHRQPFAQFPTATQRILSIHHSVFRGNSAGEGGGAWIGSGIVDVRAAHFASNTAATFGGGLHGRALRITRGTFVRNRAGQEGGGIHAYIAQHPFPGLTTNVVSNTLVVQNEAPRGAGIYGSAMRILNSTIADNVGPGLDAGQSTVKPAITITNSLLVANSSGECFASPGGTGLLSVQGSNLQFPNATCGGIAVADPTLDPLYAPVVGSPALDSADLKLCLEAPVSGRDVYGEPRPQGRGCSLGAVEGAVDRLVYDRLQRSRHEIPRDLIERLRDAVAAFQRKFGAGTSPP